MKLLMIAMGVACACGTLSAEDAATPEDEAGIRDEWVAGVVTEAKDELSSLPATVKVPDGQLALVADFSNAGEDGVPLYLVNRTDTLVKLPDQDGDLYLKLEYQQDDGKWVRVQTHRYSWCGNSYGLTKIPPGRYLELNGFVPGGGKERNVRYRRYFEGGPELVSNTGRLRVSDADVDAAEADEMAIRHGDLEFLTAIATGRKVMTQAADDLRRMRIQAVQQLQMGRFQPAEVIPLLRALTEDEDAEVAKAAQWALAQAERRLNK